jgi:hypothetical protein
MTNTPRRGPLRLRIFVSSPGDVGAERRHAVAVLERLSRAEWAAGRLEIEPVLWDDKREPAPLEAGRSPQESVEYYKRMASECDLTVVILATRLGSAAERSGGERIRSGTLAEFESAMAAGKPVFVYRSKKAVEIARGSEEHEQDKALKQFRDVEAFFKTRFANTKGELTGGFTDYDNPEGFERILEQHLQAFARRRLEEHGKPYWVPGIDDEHFFVGRDAELAKLRALVFAARNAVIHHTPGVGKSALALELVRDRSAMLRSFAGVLWLSVGKEPALQLQPQLERWADELGLPETLRQTLSSPEHWKREIAAAIGTRRMLIVLDDVWETEHAAGPMRLASHSVFVVTTRQQDVASLIDDSGGEQLVQLDDLKAEPALALLSHYAPKAVEFERSRAKALVESFGGLPLSLELMGKHLRPASNAGNREIIARAFEKLEAADVQLGLRRGKLRPEGQRSNDTLREIIAVSWRALETDELRDAFAELAVFRPKPYFFNREMTSAVWDLEGRVGVDATLDKLSRLVGAGLIGSRDEDFSIHPIIHAFAEEQLSAERKALLRRRMLAWLGSEIDHMIHGPDLYALWYRYENVKWQYAKDHWLYYLAISGDERGSMLAFLRVYLDAFWWWGFFEAFAFCDQLVEDWSRRKIGQSQLEGLEQLRNFAAQYPKGAGRRGTPALWQACEAALLDIRRRTDLDAAEGDDAARVRGLTDFLLAECAGYGRNDLDGAIRRLEGAHATFVGRDAWTAGYLSAYLAQFELEAGRADAARAHVGRGFVEAAAQGDDPEMLSFLHRVIGDIDLGAGAQAQALQSYQRAAAYAFAYQAVPETADAYTVKFFDDTAARLCARIIDLAPSDLGRALALADGLHALWQPWWQRHPPAPAPNYKGVIVEGGPADAARERLRQALFPPMPDPGSTEGRLALARQVLEVLDDLCRAAQITRPHAAAG